MSFYILSAPGRQMDIFQGFRRRRGETNNDRPLVFFYFRNAVSPEKVRLAKCIFKKQETKPPGRRDSRKRYNAANELMEVLAQRQ